MSNWVNHLGSLKFALAGFVLLCAGVLAVQPGGMRGTWALAGPLALLAVSLGCAIVANPVFRRQGALLAFHLALFVIVVLVAVGRLTSLSGQLELAEGEVFSGQLTRSEAGPWHRSQLAQVRFINDGFTITYNPGVRRDETRNRVRWLDDAGQEQKSVIGDSEPLVRHGYRFYTSFNKGFAPVFIWHPTGGAPQRGTINLPAYPIHEHRQALEWTPPGASKALWTMLQFDEVVLDPERATQFRLPERHMLVVRSDDRRYELAPGGRLSLPEGVLVYEKLSTWMGYTVFYDWTLPWLIAACVFAVASLARHFWKKFSDHPW